MIKYELVKDTNRKQNKGTNIMTVGDNFKRECGSVAGGSASMED